MTRQLKFEDILDLPIVKVTIIDTHDDGRPGVDELGSFIVTFDEAVKLKAKSQAILKGELDRMNTPETIVELGLKKNANN
jgi:hypothetical protein